MIIEKALPGDAEEIFAIYEELKGSPGCTWDESYPTLEFVKNDIEKRNSLYKLSENGRVIAAAYLGDFEEVETPECFDKSVKRFGGLALLVGTENTAAITLYEKLGFVRCGEGNLYDTAWFFYEYIPKG